MAQKEISLMQVRMGKQRDLPLALEKGQLGLSTDVGRMFIGLPSSSDPASIVAGRTWENAPNSGKENIEIITEFTPWSIINNIVNRPYKTTVPANGSVTVNVQSTSRVFLEYIAYSNATGSTLLESGAVQMVVQGSTVLLSQQNNTNQPDGLVVVEYEDPSYDSGTQRMSITLSNNSNEAFTVEYILRGWDAF
ncbi:putative structural protein [Erwinia phage pEa_SNUABM_50]|uniref:Structural protein n=4 Tax=Eneladusvirus BF TaxID=2560751 RepID=A0A1S6UAP6_9CAUD|nr:virion structural protein [Serratia phage BF]QOI71237.1 putative structural protein [Erwinia phage pEa_SNUABM_12]QOI71781.1 putative structural protein [Erwinia phage pEa_SNUABM_47]QOI72320.1 putative structural protein [Erwinia phage pEa_SNUABM_50]QXO11446.1 hypothetical protein pEaSNUABM19_00300 [Erwinia phage pEa_SNUABM_19]QXO11994.1 hypothetical protein pEaSNUABM44_00298 [Erwinia phage pEa_SNUABM_44]QXO12547.1 hypothetical protein pEaSNUABM49_00301 [Erwinia phage pEa_SNUABM_49]